MKYLSKIAGLTLAALALTTAYTSCSKKQAASGETAQKVVRINFQTGSLCAAPVHVAMKM